MGSLKEVRYPITALFVLLIFSAVTVVSRQQLETATTQVETLIIAKLLQELPTNRVYFQGPSLDGPPETQGEQMAPVEADATWEQCVADFGKIGAVEVMGQFARVWHRDSSGHRDSQYRTRMVGGGWLYFTVRMPSQERFIEELESKEKLRQQAEEWKRSGHKRGVEVAPKRLKPRTAFACGKRRELFFIAVTIDRSSERQSSTVSPSRAIVLSNIETHRR